MRKKILSLLLPILLLVAGVAWAVAPGAGITGTQHDFTQGELAANIAVGLCTFCHTPHKAGTQRLIWNHELPNQSYNWGTVTHTIGGTPLPTIDTSWTGPTRFCLSCHDGSVAFGSVYWFDRKVFLGDVAKINVGTEDKMTDHERKLVGFGGSLAGSHPVAAPYPLNNGKNTYNSVTTGDGVLMGDFVANPQPNGIRLFSDNGGVVVAGASAGTTGIECSSCHDPHNKASVDKYFLRGMLTGSDASYICLKCHTK